MTATTSRAPSARPASAARNIQKRRDKPYKTEQSRVVARKRKLDLHTTYTNPPDGFQFLPVGTPDLADRCKELSRQRGLPVNVVNAKPVSKHAVDPEKVSHHIHRIGYHFRSDVVDDACQELGYVHVHDNFIKEADLAAQNENTRMARALARFGLSWDIPTTGQETNEKVRAAIKELFPRIPEEDLKAILDHAWEEGSHRVGTNSTIELPRRVQLATIARIRHTYTDYDRLLRAFEWKEARALVEPTCLKKLIEWRGENEDEDDNELEEIVRETIVIDDDDNDNSRLRRGSEADDEDSAADIDQGYASDTSLEISHKPAAIEDLGAESYDERSRRFLARHQPPARNMQQRFMDVRQKIGLARQQLRDAHVIDQPTVVRVHVPQSPHDDGTIMIDGRMYRRAPVSVDPSRSPAYYAPGPPPAQGHVVGQPLAPPYAMPASPHRTDTSFGRGLQDQPVASIETQDNLRRKAMSSATAGHTRAPSNGHRSHPVSPVRDSTGKRRRLDSHGQNGSSNDPAQYYRSPLHTPSRPPGADLKESIHVQPQADHRGSPFADRPSVPETQPRQGVTFVHGAPAPLPTYGLPQGTVQKDPRVHQNGTVMDSRAAPKYGFVDAQVAPIQYVPISRQYLPRPQAERHVGYGPGNNGRSVPQVMYVNQVQPGYAYQAQPVHGAPAPVQPAPVTVPAPYPAGAPQYAPQPRYYYPG
ncbi:hypothetical protein CKM354_000332700 [Cercospora kikuchii]|uniref:DUF2293 domain-containing protein n=1 Tax=Cercospora kikuchii TaxID=84275 RepID=A0A9P3CBV2_9PEZI|nr:uncharacterized protein CKM354_000332700 [Cercospora kikuchii]GIZ39968.1 hypothetical protein CKM354_000332700 [Cercospora kikuchii]